MTDSEKIWRFLLDKTGNPYGTAAIMGNLMAESSLSPACATGLNKTPFSTVSQYIIASDGGTHDFANDGVAFGIAQWCFHTRKQGLLDIADCGNRSIGDLDVQLAYLYTEMRDKYPSVWKAVITTTDVREASDVVMLKYEKPANTSESAKLKRANYAQKFYDQYVVNNVRLVVITNDNVNLRYGNDKHYGSHTKVNKNDSFKWVATAENGWHAVEWMRLPQRVLWVHPDFSELRG